MVIFNSYVKLPEGILNGFFSPFLLVNFLDLFQRSSMRSTVARKVKREMTLGWGYGARFFWGKQWFLWCSFNLNYMEYIELLELLDPKSQGSMLCVEIGYAPKSMSIFWVPTKVVITSKLRGTSDALPISPFFMETKDSTSMCCWGSRLELRQDVAGDVTGMMLN